MRVAHLGDLAGRRKRGFSRPPVVIPYGFPGEMDQPKDKYVIIDPTGKGIAVVTDIPKLAEGWTFRLATPTEAATGKTFQPAMSGLGSWIVRGPEGEVYGRYEEKPDASKIPLYAIAEQEKDGWLGNDGSVF